MFYLARMSLPLFFVPEAVEAGAIVDLPEDTARHVVQVLRMEPGQELMLTNGQGRVAHSRITETGKKRCSVTVVSHQQYQPEGPSLTLAVAFTRHAGRNEWLLEKATELGVRNIIPILAHRSTKERFRFDRWAGILISAMLQSQQYFLPTLHEPQSLQQILQAHQSVPQKLVAHCMPNLPRIPVHQAFKNAADALLLIGPEGDFTEEEVQQAMAQGAQGIDLGNTRLRTETAAMAVCAYFKLINS